ncbi:hypothetical protein HELRODRAFT_152153, partial [Helobdella robusta]|uniref:J domain-containing protein n=1 Tax=Helobdella robusta TaxID=6412 RepID=T1EKP9_HELRO
EMENLYEILQVDPKASQQEIKRSFQKLALKFHPDKLPTRGDTNMAETRDRDGCQLFQRISTAWSVLGDPDQRKQYDALWHHRCVLFESCGPIHDRVPFNGFKKCTETNEYLYECRCSDYLVLTEQDVCLKLDVVNCSTCSLNVIVDY